jgi:hypothetical protein
MTVGEEECDSHQSAAERHRAAAAFHECTVSQLTAAEATGRPSGDFLHQQERTGGRTLAGPEGRTAHA